MIAKTITAILVPCLLVLCFWLTIEFYKLKKKTKVVDMFPQAKKEKRVKKEIDRLLEPDKPLK
jgi:Na+/melibiose symporter-like transporter